MSLLESFVNKIRNTFPNIYRLYTEMQKKRSELESNIGYRFARIQTVMLTFNITTLGTGNEVQFVDIVFDDGTQQHVIYNEASGQLITTLNVPYGASIGFAFVRVRNNIFSTVPGLVGFCEIQRNGVLHGSSEKQAVGGVGEPLDVINFSGAELGGNWVITSDETITVNAGYVS